MSPKRDSDPDDLNTPTSSEIEELHMSIEELDRSTVPFIDLRARLRRVQRRIGMDVVDTGSFPVVTHTPTPGE